MKTLKIVLISLFSFSLIFAGCAKKDSGSSGDSSSGGTAETEVSVPSGSGSVSLASKVSIVDAKTSESSSRSAAAIDVTSFSATVDYNVDQSTTFVYEETADALSTVNEILCMIGQGRADLMINEGNYKAQVDTKKCSSHGDSQSNAPTYELWTINSSRTDGQPMQVKGWVPNSDGGEIRFNMKVYQPPSDSYPIGFFNMNFKSLMSGVVYFKGFMRTLSEGTKNYLEFYMPIACSNGSCGDSDLDGQTMERGVKASFNSDETGAGVTSVPIFSFDQSSGKVSMTNTKYNFAYNKDYFYKQKEGGTAQCMDRNSYNQMAFRYGLYDSNGSRVKLNSGFPIKATVSGTEYDGYIGYYGVWMQGQTLTSDTTVTKLDYSDPTASGTDYTLKVYNGKLFKHTKQDVTLDNIKNIPLDWYDMSDSTQKRVVWNGTNLVSDAKRDPANNYQWANYETPEVITLTASNAPYGFYFYSRALGGDGQIKLTYASFGGDPSAPTGTTNVIFHTRAPVFVGDTVPSNLTCYERCPNASRLATGSSSSSGGSSSVYETAVWSDNLTAGLVGSNGGYKYTFSTSSSEMVLKDSSSTSVALTSKNDNLSYGLRSGILFDNSSANYQALLCPWDSDDTASSGDTICPWRAREALSEFYTWESGTDDWQKTTLLIDSSGDALKFDSPISVKYAHPSTSTSSNSGKNYAGTNFFLEYGGFGNLWGIPSFCVDSSTGKKTNCASSGTRWVEEFVIAAGANASKASDSSVEYVIKPLEVEQSMKEADASKCTDAGLTLGDDTVPDISNFTDPKIGDKPSVTGPPAILDGNKTGS